MTDTPDNEVVNVLALIYIVIMFCPRLLDRLVHVGTDERDRTSTTSTDTIPKIDLIGVDAVLYKDTRTTIDLDREQEITKIEVMLDLIINEVRQDDCIKEV